jgi:hypothetical protein
MAKERLILPEQNVREYAHELACKLAREQLAGIADIEEQCRKSGTRYLKLKKAVGIAHLNRAYQIGFPDGKVSLANSDEAVPIRDQILLLHYFTQARGTPLSGKTITYKELHDGINYYPTFAKRTIQPLVTFFGQEPEQLLKTAEALGGHKAGYGDVAVTINAFPHVPVTLVLWRGDKEFPPEGSIMFDSTISDYLTNDDIHTLCENIAWRLVRLLKTGGDNHAGQAAPSKK